MYVLYSLGFSSDWKSTRRLCIHASNDSLMNVGALMADCAHVVAYITCSEHVLQQSAQGCV